MTKYNPDIHHRRSIRLKGYDYSQAGLYFITICTKNREHLFGQIENGIMILNEFGEIANNEWSKTADIRDNVELLEYIIMPNHMHGIILLNDMDDRRGTARRAPTMQFGKPIPRSLPTIIRAFKSAVTKQINILRNKPGMPVWQRNYYEHIIRNEKSYYRIAEYIIYNPLKWQDDRYCVEGNRI